MLKQFSAVDPLSADALVGQYYTSRVFPLLLMSLAFMVASSLLPHLIKDWEAGRRDLAMQKINRAVKLTAVGFTVGAAMLLLAAPLIFSWAFGGKYDTGLKVLPGTLVYCIWFSMLFFANRYLLCAENARAGRIAFAVGLAANLGLNYFLAPRFGLAGVVFATGTANAVALAVTYGISWRVGMQWDRGIVFASLLPLALCLGGWQAFVVSMLACFVGWRGGWLFAETEKQALSEMLHTLVQRARSLDECVQRKSKGKGKMLRKKQRSLTSRLDRGPLRTMFVISSMPVGGAETLLLNLIRHFDRECITPEL